MAGIGDSWGTKEELLHPRGPDGRWIRKAGVAKGIIDAVLGFLAAFRPRTFQNQSQANQYLQNIAHRQGRRRMGRADHVRLRQDLTSTNADLRDGVIDEPSTKRFVEMMDRSAVELPDDTILARVVGVDAFGFTPETAKGTNSDTDPGIRGMSGKLVADRGYGLHVVGDIEAQAPAGTVRMVVAAKKGTKVVAPAAGAGDSTIFLDRDQPLRVTKIRPDASGGWTMFVTTDDSRGKREVPTPIGGPVGEGRKPSREREASIRESMGRLAKAEKQPDEAKEQADVIARQQRAEEAARTPAIPSPQQRAEEQRVAQLPQQPAPGEPPPRTEPVVGRVGEAPAAGAPGVAPTPGAPEPTPAGRAVDIRRAVQDAGISSPSRGKQLQEWNEAYLGLKSGKMEPDEAARNLDANIRRNRGLVEDLRSRPGNEAQIADVEANIQSQEQLRDLIREQYGLPGAAPAKKAAPGKRTEAGLPKVAKQQVQTRRSQRELEAEERNKAAAAAEKKAAPKKAPAKKAAKATGFTEAQERAIIDRAKEFRGKERNEEETRIVRQADEILARRQGAAPVKAGRAPAKKAGLAPAAKKTLPPVAKKAPAKAAPEAPGDDLDKMTKKELMDVATREGVTHGGSMTKDKLKDKIRKMREIGEPTPDSRVGREQRIMDLLGVKRKPTVAQLREYAREQGIGGDIGPRDRRNDLIDKILSSVAQGAGVDVSPEQVQATRALDRPEVTTRPAKKAVPREPFNAGRKAEEVSAAMIGAPGRERVEQGMRALEGLNMTQLRQVSRELGIQPPGRDRREGKTPEGLREWIARNLDSFGMPGTANQPTLPEAPAPVKKAAKAAPSTPPSSDSIRQQLVSMPPDQHFPFMEDTLQPLNLTQSRALARGLGVKGAGRSEKPEIALRIAQHFEGAGDVEAVARLEGPRAPVKKAAKAAAPRRMTIGEARRISAVVAIRQNEITGNGSSSWKNILTNVESGDWSVARARKEAKNSARYWREQATTVRRAGTTGTPEGREKAASRLEGIADQYDKLAEDLTISQSVTKTDRYMRPGAAVPDLEQGARDRQAKIDTARSYGRLGAEIEELIDAEVEPDVLSRGILRAGRGLPPEELDQLVRAAESGNTNDVRARMGKLLQDRGVNLHDRPGSVELFDPRRHQSIGGDIPEGSPVHIVRPGSETNIDGEFIHMDKAVVEPATPKEIADRQRAQRLVPEGSVEGTRTSTPVNNALRKRVLRKAWVEADITPPPPGSGRKSHEEIKGDLVAGRITPEEAIRRYESEVAFTKEDLAEVDAHLRETDLSSDERAKVERHRANLQATIDSHEKQSTFLRDYFKEEAPAVSLKEAKEQDPVSYEFLKDAKPDDMREAAKEAGLDAPSGDTVDEMFTDLLKQVAKRELDRRAAKKAAKKAVPAKKVAPTVPRDKERVDARLLAEGLDLGDKDIAEVQEHLDQGKLTPRQIAENVDFHARRMSDSNAIAHGAWDIGGPDKRTPEEEAERERNLVLGRARVQALKDYAERIRGVRRRSVAKKVAPAKVAPEVKSRDEQIDDLQKRIIDNALSELQGAKSRDKADDALEGLTMPDLRRLAEQSGIKPPRTKRALRDAILDRFKGSEGPVSIDQLTDLPSREASHEIVDKLGKPELLRLAREMSVPGAGSKNMKQLREEIVEGTTGRRLDSIAIRGFEGPMPQTPDAPRTRSLGVRAGEAGIQSPRSDELFSGAVGATDEADRRLQAGESPTEVARWLRARAAQVSKADLNEEGRRFKVDYDQDTLRARRKASAEYLRRLGTFIQQENKATKATPAPVPERPGGPDVTGRLTTAEKGRRAHKAAFDRARDTAPSAPEAPVKKAPAKKAAPGRPALTVVPGGRSTGARTRGEGDLRVIPGGRGTVSGQRSTTPEARNDWGMLGTGGEVEFHDDGVIGQRLRGMGDDRLMDIDGEPVSNAVGKLATRAVRGQISQEQLIDELKRLAQRLPAGSRARQGVDNMVRDLDAPSRGTPDIPSGTPTPMRKLMQDLLRIPVARDKVDRPGFHRDREQSEVDKLLRLMQDFQEGRTGGLRLIGAIRDMRMDLPHESVEGRFEADRALREAHDALEKMYKNPETRFQLMPKRS